MFSFLLLFLFFFAYCLYFAENVLLIVFGYFFQKKNIAVVGLTIQEAITYAQNKHILVGRTVKFPFQLKSVVLNYEFIILSLTAQL